MWLGMCGMLERTTSAWQETLKIIEGRRGRGFPLTAAWCSTLLEAGRKLQDQYAFIGTRRTVKRVITRVTNRSDRFNRGGSFQRCLKMRARTPPHHSHEQALRRLFGASLMDVYFRWLIFTFATHRQCSWPPGCGLQSEICRQLPGSKLI